MPFYRFENFLFDPERECLTRDGEAVPIRPKTAELLHFFLQHRHDLLTKQAILDEVWQDTHVTEAVLFQTISDLRKVLGQTRSKIYIENVKRKGYHWAIEDTHFQSGDDSSTAADPEPAVAPPTSDVSEPTLALDPAVVIDVPDQASPAPKTKQKGRNWWPLVAVAALLVMVIPAMLLFQSTPEAVQEPPPISPQIPPQQSLTMVLGHISTESLERTAERIGEQVVTRLNATGNYRAQLSRQEITNDIIWTNEGTSHRSDFARHLAKQQPYGFAAVTWIEETQDQQLDIHMELYDHEGLRLKENLIQPDIQAASNWIRRSMQNYFSVLDYWSNRALQMIEDPKIAYTFALGNIAMGQGSPEAAYSIYDRLRQEIGDHPLLILMIARSEYNRGNVAEADALTESVTIKGNDAPAIMLKITKKVNQISLARRRSNIEEALEYANEAITLAEQIDNPIEHGLAKINAGNVLRELTRLDEAEQLFIEALDTFSKHGHQIDLPTVYLNLGNVYFYKGKYEEAISEYDHAISLHEETGQPWEAIGPLLNTGAVLNHLGKREEALAKLTKAETLANERRDHRLQTQVHINFGNVAMSQNAFSKAMNHYQKARDTAENYGHYDLVYTTSYNTALAAINGGFYNQAKPHLDYLWQNKGPNKNTVRKMYGYYYHNVGEHEKALAYLEESKKEGPAEWDAQDQGTLDLVYEALGRPPVSATPTQ